MIGWLDTHWIDILSVVTGLGYTALVRARSAKRQSMLTKQTALDFVAGLALAPLVLLFIGAFSETVLAALTRTNALILAAASVIAIFSILEDPEPH